MFLLVPAYLGSPGPRAFKRLCVCVCVLPRLFSSLVFVGLTDVIPRVSGHSADEFVCCLGDGGHGYVAATTTSPAVWH